MSRKSSAFLSYVREVDEVKDVTRFRESLEQAVRELGLEDFSIFHDRLDVQWGDDWRERVKNSLDKVQILITIISPGLFRSEPCRFEIEFFWKERQK
ncbi:TIR domain-containing protein [Inquilinus sp. CA228]|uniref:TIR domain-containing protein n=1 Tax=Inquilinus sp. CA228 TaxID=3455609 RepID=UPI003F8D1F24